MARAACVTALVILCGLGVVGPAAADDPLDLIPADNLLCWKGLPYPGAGQTSTQPAALPTLIEMGRRIFRNRLDKQAQLTLRIVESLGIVGRHAFAVTLIDARAKPAREDGTGSKVDRLSIAAVIKTEGESKPFLRLIKLALDEQTDAGVAKLEEKRVGRWVYQELRDSRLPEWCVVAWGELDEHFVITLGDGVWPLIASVAAGETQPLSKDAWIAKVRQRYSQEPLIEIVVAAQGIRERLDPFVQGRATAFFEVWRHTDARRAHWALGFQERALYCVANYRENDRTVRRVYADADVRDPRWLKTIPERARYAIYRLDVPVFLPRLISSYYATRSEEDRQAAARLWDQIQTRLGVDAERDALAHLGNTIVAHNYPPHPLHLPLAFTSLIEIRDEPAKVRQTLEKLCGAWQAAIEEIAAESGVPSPAQLYRDDDGVWFFQFGPVASLAWTFTDKFIVTSWSPAALRQYLDHVGDRAGQRP